MPYQLPDSPLLRMSEHIRALPPLLRYSVYAAAVILMLFVAVGVGATAAVVSSWQPGWVATDSTETSTVEGSKSETTGPAKASEDTAIDPSGDSSGPDTAVEEVSFVHNATDANSRGDYAYISNPSIDSDPNAVVLAVLSPDRGSAGAAADYGHNIGVWYEPVARKWAIFNQDRAAVPAGTTFEVVVPPASTTFVHRAELLNTFGNYTYLDDPLTNGRPDADVEITQNWNPGGGGGIYNDHPVGTVYDEDVQQWAIYNLDGVPIPEGAAFNVAVSTNAKEPAG